MDTMDTMDYSMHYDGHYEPQVPIDTQLTTLATQFQQQCSTLSNLAQSLSGSSPSKQTKQLQDELRRREKELTGLLQQIEELVEEQTREEDAESEESLLLLNGLKSQYSMVQRSVRRAKLLFQKNIEDNFKSDRQALIGSEDPQRRQQKLQTEEQLVDSAEDITASLQRTRHIMLQELDHTEATLAAMDMSERTLKGAKDEYKGQKSHHKRSRALLGTMKRHSLLDTLTVWGGFAIFLSTVAYVISKRSMYFVPQFARDLVAAPFRSRNSTSLNVTGPTTSTNLADHSGKTQEQYFTPAELQTDAASQEQIKQAPDLTDSGDVKAGLREINGEQYLPSSAANNLSDKEQKSSSQEDVSGDSHLSESNASLGEGTDTRPEPGNIDDSAADPIERDDVTAQHSPEHSELLDSTTFEASNAAENRSNTGHGDSPIDAQPSAHDSPIEGSSGTANLSSSSPAESASEASSLGDHSNVPLTDDRVGEPSGTNSNEAKAGPADNDLGNKLAEATQRLQKMGESAAEAATLQQEEAYPSANGPLLDLSKDPSAINQSRQNELAAEISPMSEGVTEIEGEVSQGEGKQLSSDQENLLTSEEPDSQTAKADSSTDSEAQASPDVRHEYDKWAGTRSTEASELNTPSPTTRQEDTELGIFRPDEL